MQRLYCAGCALNKSFPNNCHIDCPVLSARGNKYTSLLMNYNLIMSYRNNKNDFKNKKK